MYGKWGLSQCNCFGTVHVVPAEPLKDRKYTEHAGGSSNQFIRIIQPVTLSLSNLLTVPVNNKWINTGVTNSKIYYQKSSLKWGLRKRVYTVVKGNANNYSINSKIDYKTSNTKILPVAPTLHRIQGYGPGPWMGGGALHEIHYIIH